MAFHPPSELIIRPDGTIYHLNLSPKQIAPTIILVGDPGRVDTVSRHFQRIDFRVQTREFKTHTGVFNHKPVTVISTGIGTDNIDIVINEIDALFNIDLITREDKTEFTKLNFIRIGTSGSMQPDLPVDTFLASSHGLGLGGLMHFYDYKKDPEETIISYEIQNYGKINFPIKPYVAKGSSILLEKMAGDLTKGITATCPGFYAPQGRQLRGKVFQEDYLLNLRQFKYKDHRITNFEMETAGIYGMSSMLGHDAISFNALLANRANGTFSEKPQETVERLVELVLNRI